MLSVSFYYKILTAFSNISALKVDLLIMDFEELRLSAEERKKVRVASVRKAIHYFEDRNNRSWSQDSLLTRRRNLASHLGVDETVDRKEVQKINASSLPVPSSVLKNRTVDGATAR